MNQIDNNPISNQLGSGLTENQVLNAIEKSGYPLQTIISDTLRRQFSVQEEWSYIDRDSKDLRTIDILANLRLYDWDSQPRVRPQLNLLIECKQSQLPYVFFLTGSPPGLPDFPMLAGLQKDEIVITSDDDPSSWHYGVLQALGLVTDPFQLSPSFCHIFSKCVRKGSELELSGSEAYNGVVLPLIKALQHFAIAEKPVQTALYFDAHLTVAVGVLDAPMVGVKMAGGVTELVLLPWVRILRHEYLSDADHWHRSKLWVVDVVHKEYFSEYIEKHLVPFVQRFAQLAIKHQHVIATGKGFASGMGRESWSNIEGRIQPMPLGTSIRRTRLVIGNILALIFRHRRRDS
jgi:hypothetical protein